MHCGEKIADLRKKNGMTQDDLGKEMNVSYQAVSKWERDESQPDFETMSKIAKLFNVPLSYFEEGGELNVEREEPKEAPKEETKEEVKEVKEEKTEPVSDGVVGTCTECGKLLKESEVATYAPKIVCKTCSERQKREKQKAAEEELQKRKWEREREARDILGHGFDPALVISLILALAGYVALAVVTFLYGSTDDAYFYGSLLFLCPIALFGLVFALIDLINDLRDTDDDSAYTRNLSLIIGACFAVVNIGLFLALYLVYDSTFFLILLGAGAVVSFTFVSQFLWGGVVKDIFTAGGITFKIPGFIFKLEINSIIWMIITKIFLGILAAIIFVVTAIIMTVVAMLGSVFLFIPSVIWKSSKDALARKRLKNEEKADEAALKQPKEPTEI